MGLLVDLQKNLDRDPGDDIPPFIGLECDLPMVLPLASDMKSIATSPGSHPLVLSDINVLRQFVLGCTIGPNPAEPVKTFLRVISIPAPERHKLVLKRDDSRKFDLGRRCNIDLL